MLNFRTGDLVAKRHPSLKLPLQVGIVICDDLASFTIKWTSFNKDFFMHKEEDIFKELNKTYLLDTVQVSRSAYGSMLYTLSSNYIDEHKTRNQGKN
jgi:hypothetical protein